MRLHQRQGVSLVEVLVVIGIIGVLVGLLLPAVQQVRAASLKTKCSGNLRQIGIAAQNYHSSLERLPSGMRFANGTDPMLYSSWLVALLPYLEQTEQWNIAQRDYSRSRFPFAIPTHFGLASVIPTLNCPADSRTNSAQVARRSGYAVAFTSFLGCAGRDLLSNDGVLFRDSLIRFCDVTDGTSQTILAGERPPSVDFQFGWWYAGTGQNFTGSLDMLLGTNELNLSNGSCSVGPYKYQTGKLIELCDMFHFWSPHPNGASFLMVDGSVRFLNYSASTVLTALGSRSGGEVVDGPD